MTAAGIAELDDWTRVEVRLTTLAELSITLLPGIVEPDVSVTSGLEKAMECPTVDEVFPVMAFLSSSILEESLPPIFFFFWNTIILLLLCSLRSHVLIVVPSNIWKALEKCMIH
ncbi:hypothetical protein ACFX1X_013740 [Malus domestica]